MQAWQSWGFFQQIAYGSPQGFGAAIRGEKAGFLRRKHLTNVTDIR